MRQNLFSLPCRRVGLAIAMFLAIDHAVAQSAPLGGKFFQGLGASSDAFFGIALDVSADGTTVVGVENGPKRLGFRWTAETGYARLNNFVADAKAVSADGSAIAGNSDFGRR